MHNEHDGNVDAAKITKLQPSTLENIDAAMFEWIDEHLDINCTTNTGFRKVPVVWTSAERSFQVKNDKEIRDKDGALIYPIITVARSSISKDRAKKGVFWAPIMANKDYRGGTITIAKEINQEKTANFANADAFKTESIRQLNFVLPKTRKKTVFRHISIPIPVYLDITYDINVKTQFQEQMNEISSPFMTQTGGLNYFPLQRNGHFYEAFIQSEYSQENNIASMAEEERTYQTKIQIKVLGYIFGEDANQLKPYNVVRENAVEVRISRERNAIGEKPEIVDVTDKYRELGEKPG